MRIYKDMHGIMYQRIGKGNESILEFFRFKGNSTKAYDEIKDATKFQNVFQITVDKAKFTTDLEREPTKPETRVVTPANTENQTKGKK